MKKLKITTKTCSRCVEEKDVSEFWKDKRNKDGYKYVCIECLRTDNKKCKNCGKSFKPDNQFSKFHNRDCYLKYTTNSDNKKYNEYNKKERQFKKVYGRLPKERELKQFII